MNTPGSWKFGKYFFLNSFQTQQVMDLASIRPSPVKFTNQRPDQFPIKPEPERVNPQAMADAMKIKMLSLENLKCLPDFGKCIE